MEAARYVPHSTTQQTNLLALIPRCHCSKRQAGKTVNSVFNFLARLNRGIKPRSTKCEANFNPYATAPDNTGS